VAEDTRFELVRA